MSDSPGFCRDCGSILPPLKATGGSVCYLCRKEHSATALGDMRTEYNIYFNSIKQKESIESSDDEVADGPIVQRKCKKCDNNTMSYKTLQLRSVDEGQTVFFTCTKCNFKESENS